MKKLLFAFVAVLLLVFLASCGNDDCKNHTIIATSYVEPTCTKEGKTAGKICSVCGEIIESALTISPKGHSPVTVPEKAATCTEDGFSDSQECSVCHEILSPAVVIKAKGHKEIIQFEKTADCINTGLTEGKKCSVCGYDTLPQKEIPALGHKTVSISGKLATCTENGLTDGEKCKVCGEITVKQNIIPAGHNEIELIGKASTCIENGLTNGVGCSACNAVFTEQKIIPALGHTDENGDLVCDFCNGKTYNEICVTEFPYEIVWNKINEKALAEDLASEIKKLTGVSLGLIKNKDSDYKILFGTVTDFDECKIVHDNLVRNYINDNTSAYAIKYAAENVIVVTATDYEALEMASKKLLSYIIDGKFVIPEILDEASLVVSYIDGIVEVPLSDFASSTLLSGLKIFDFEFYELSKNKSEYLVKYPSTESYPLISERSVYTVNKNAKVTVLQAADNNGKAEITVESENSENTTVYTIEFDYEDSVNIKSEIVNKDGKDAVVTFVFDDGDKHTADILLTNLLPKYEDIRLSFGLITKQLASITDDGNGGVDITAVKYSNNEALLSNSYFLDTSYEYNFDFWKKAMEFRDGIEILSHGQEHTAEYARDYPWNELIGSRAVIYELLGLNTHTYVLPFGDGPIRNDPEHSAYYEILQGGTYIGARGASANVVTVDWFKTFKNRFEVPAYAVQCFGTSLINNTSETSTKDECLNAGIDKWTDYINSAVEKGGWAGFCLHTIAQDQETNIGKWDIFESQADELFAYAQKLSDEGKLWIATYTEAQIYYNEWSTAEVTTVLESDKKITVSVTDSEDNSEIYNMPLTVKVSIPRSWTAASFSYNGELSALTVHESEDGGKFVYVNIIPDVGSLVITE